MPRAGKLQDKSLCAVRNCCAFEPDIAFPMEFISHCSGSLPVPRAGKHQVIVRLLELTCFGIGLRHLRWPIYHIDTHSSLCQGQSSSSTSYRSLFRVDMPRIRVVSVELVFISDCSIGDFRLGMWHHTADRFHCKAESDAASLLVGQCRADVGPMLGRWPTD